MVNGFDCHLHCCRVHTAKHTLIVEWSVIINISHPHTAWREGFPTFVPPVWGCKRYIAGILSLMQLFMYYTDTIEYINI